MPNYHDLVITDLAAAEASLRAQFTDLIDLVADLAFENYRLRRAFEHELLERIYGDAALARIRRRAGVQTAD